MGKCGIDKQHAYGMVKLRVCAIFNFLIGTLMRIMNSSIVKNVLGLLSISVIVFAVAGFGCAPKIEWEPALVAMEVPQGGTVTHEVAIRSNVLLNDVSIIVDSELASRITVTPSSVDLVPRKSVVVKLSVELPSGQKPEIVKGKLKPKMGTKNLRNALPITLEIQPAKVSLGDISVSYVVPEGWNNNTQSIDGEVFAELFSPESSAEIEAGSLATPPDVFIEVVTDSQNQMLEEFIQSYLGGWLDSYAIREFSFVGRYEALILDDTSNQLPKAPPRVVVMQVDDSKVIVTFGWRAVGIADSLLSTLRINSGGM